MNRKPWHDDYDILAAKMVEKHGVDWIKSKKNRKLIARAAKRSLKNRREKK